MAIFPDYCLRSHNTLAIPAKAKFFTEVADNEALADALKFANKENLPLLILGGGSNLVLKDDFPGLAILIKHEGIEEVGEDEDFVFIEVGAGENWHKLVEHCLSFHLWGLENLSLIPGNVGAAPIQNIGAYGVELQDVFLELQAMEVQSRVLVNFEKPACEFGYRDSVFKNRFRDRYVITRVTLKLPKEPSVKIEYPALQKVLSGSDVSPQQVSAAVCAIRRSKLPDPALIPNAGSFFKNPVVDDAQRRPLQLEYPQLVAYSLEDGTSKLAAGWLIEAAGLKGFQQGSVGVHMDQALVLVNNGDSENEEQRGKDLLALAELVKKKVFEKFQVNLEMEPRVYP
jgi:UDP-N-acetylmuramate dehydrogenase